MDNKATSLVEEEYMKLVFDQKNFFYTEEGQQVLKDKGDLEAQEELILIHSRIRKIIDTIDRYSIYIEKNYMIKYTPVEFFYNNLYSKSGFEDVFFNWSEEMITGFVLKHAITEKEKLDLLNRQISQESDKNGRKNKGNNITYDDMFSCVEDNAFVESLLLKYKFITEQGEYRSNKIKGTIIGFFHALRDKKIIKDIGDTTLHNAISIRFRTKNNRITNFSSSAYKYMYDIIILKCEQYIHQKKQ